jgi:hypothetical protein
MKDGSGVLTILAGGVILALFVFALWLMRGC